MTKNNLKNSVAFTEYILCAIHWLGSGLSRKCPRFLPSPFPLCFPTPFLESWGRNENAPLLYPAVVNITDQDPLNSGLSPCTTSFVHEPIYPRDGLSQQSRVPREPLGRAAKVQGEWGTSSPGPLPPPHFLGTELHGGLKARPPSLAVSPLPFMGVALNEPHPVFETCYKEDPTSHHLFLASALGTWPPFSALPTTAHQRLSSDYFLPCFSFQLQPLLIHAPLNPTKPLFLI